MRVVIGEDEALLRQGLTLVLEQADFDVVAAVGDAGALEDAVIQHAPDLVVTDIRMPPTFTDEGLAAAVRIRKHHSETAVVVLSQHVQRRYAVELIGDGGGHVGYLLKQRISDVRTFTQDLRRVATGGTALDPDVVAILMSRARMLGGGIEALTPRQSEVLGHMAEGRSNGWIADELGLSEKAIVQHTSRIYDTLDLPVDADDHRRVRAVIHYLTHSPPTTPAGPAN
ncbi:DNA-binding NarL/FixJ family response regulator [Microbacterium endophyticum]|uniref:DNA-binding NarL/FixJ family response regulator n=1 Tax=Microbacterium endophyticum TaxID=1526412 RepID=A0A7W4V1W0_9MICO|nr:response regulator transcription factor [Microbacterium endophyticum]MBB2975209.1 DNA-binding NarL/FixJ family response regulator [Microbacterium endophyticum]NIK37579.1 DNA-binding NarL/FixJ family response regulator [Microbacterium endophyticum]